MHESTRALSFKDKRIIDDKNNNSQPSNELKQTRILMAESEPEILLLFKTYLDSLGIEAVTVEDGDKALETFIQNKNDGKGYDVVVLDTHLKGKKGLEVAKKIRQSDRSQKIVLVTTSIKEQLPKEELHISAIGDENILVMPFALSKLSKILQQ